MNKILEYTTVTFMVIGIFSLIFAVGAIDGGYNGVPMNDNWLGFIIFTIVGLSSFIVALLLQSKVERI
jgi:hypothetical protein|tara:strand:- start:41 stop:244 length:204 start_codon:yes stop_codon:yes gene_type:complete